MDGREFLKPAQDLAAGPSEAYWRAAAVHAYYALFLACRDTLARWGMTPTRLNVHAFVRLKFSYAKEPDLKKIGNALDDLVRLRNKASYDLGSLPEFASATEAEDAVQEATDALALLDAIEADPARRAAELASLPP